MLNYFLRRLLFAVPTLLAVSLAIFGLGRAATDDPIGATYPSVIEQNADEEKRLANYARLGHELGYDRPAFYFTLTTAAYPDTFHKILLPERRRWLGALAAQTGNWPAVQAFADALRHTARRAESLPDSSAQTLLRAALNDLQKTIWLDEVPARVDSVAAWAAVLEAQTGQKLSLENLRARATELQEKATPGKCWHPTFCWHGLDNQYHRWISGFFTGRLGTSFQTRTPVWDDIKSRLGMTVGLNSVAFALAFALALPLGVWSARQAGRWPDRWLRRGLMALYAMPVFWLGGLCIMFFATDGQGWKIFEGIAPNNPEDHALTLWQWFLKYANRLVLPVLVLMLHTLAVLALQMRGSVLGVLRQDFIRTARAKGLSEGAVLGRHAFRNALFPVITILGGVFPVIFGGSLVVEYLFGIPGMGTKTHDAFMSRDFPVLFAILMFSAMLTIAGSLLADMLYLLADPRVRLAKQR